MIGLEVDLRYYTELVFVFPLYLAFTPNLCKSALYVSVRVF